MTPEFVQAHPVLARFSAFDLELCRRAVRVQRRGAALRYFRLVSRLGDGTAWGVLGGVVALTGGAASLTGLGRLVAVAALASLTSRLVKGWANRPRPCAIDAGVGAGAAALDPWSFPSGHTLHAVAFQVVLIPTHPVLALVLVPWTLSIATSRVALGLHYPSDVAAGGALGAVLAALVLGLT